MLIWKERELLRNPAYSTNKKSVTTTTNPNRRISTSEFRIVPPGAWIRPRSNSPHCFASVSLLQHLREKLLSIYFSIYDNEYIYIYITENVFNINPTRNDESFLCLLFLSKKNRKTRKKNGSRFRFPLT